ncbi:MAG: ATPase [Firmicutes bacterium]|nr:ATPase [Bacillota bacterium]
MSGGANLGYYAGLDIGGTYGRFMIEREDGSTDVYIDEGCAFNTEGEALGREKYRALVEGAMRKFGTTPRMCLGLCAAASGIDSPEALASCISIFADMGFDRGKILIVNDCEIYLFSSGIPAMAAVVGTGSVCYGIDSLGKTHRAGGWNHILSDEGSSFDIGMKTIKRVAERLDGRGVDTILVKLLADEEGITSPYNADIFVNKYIFDKSRIGKISLLCDRAARMGDRAATEILTECADNFSRVILDTYKKMNVTPQESVRLTLSGGVILECELFYKRICLDIEREAPNVTAEKPKKSALETALLAARRFG